MIELYVTIYVMDELVRDVENDVKDDENSTLPETKKGVRLRGFLVLVPCVAILTIAVWLHPDGRGYGTHTQMGLPACGFKVRWRAPCPACGLTTSVSSMMHGEVGLAWKSNVFGVLLTIALILAAISGMLELVFRYEIFSRIGFSRWWIIAAGGLFVAGWAVNVFRGMD